MSPAKISSSELGTLFLSAEGRRTINYSYPEGETFISQKIINLRQRVYTQELVANFKFKYQY